MVRLVTWLRKLREKKPVTIEKHLTEGITQASKYLFVIFVFHTIAMLKFENLSISDAIWLTFTTITTVGYGDIVPISFLGRASTVILLYFGGIFILAKVAGDYFDYRIVKYQRQLMGKWRWNLNNHIVIISGSNEQPLKQYYEILAKEFRESSLYKNHTIQILTMYFHKGLPESLQQLGIVHYHGKDNAKSSLEAVNIASAEIVIVLAKNINDKYTDGHTFDILHRVRELNKEAMVLAECVDDSNRDRLQKAGANITVRPIRAYPEMVARAFNTPGSEKVIDDMFIGKSIKYQRFELNITKMLWADIVTALIRANIGTAIAYSHEGKVHCNPAGKDKITAEALIIITDDDKVTEQQASEVLKTKIVINQ